MYSLIPSHSRSQPLHFNLKTVCFISIIYLLGSLPLHANTLLERLNSQWTQALTGTVTQSQKDGVSYAALDYQAIEKKQSFHDTVTLLNKFPIKELQSKQQRLAFWINAYNIAAVDLMIRHPKAKSIRDIGSLFKPVWDKKVIHIDGQHYSLGEIEHEMLRPMGEPRIHFAIVCASLSCPDLRAEAYTARQLQQQLNEDTERFLKNPSKGLRIDKDKNTLYLSKIFQWFEADFKATETATKGEEAILEFINAHTPDLIEDKQYSIKHIPYNWKKNTISEK